MRQRTPHGPRSAEATGVHDLRVQLRCTVQPREAYTRPQTADGNESREPSATTRGNIIERGPTFLCGRNKSERAVQQFLGRKSKLECGKKMAAKLQVMW